MTDPADSALPCSGCGFVYDVTAARDAGEAILHTATTIASRVASAEDVDHRPDANTWSILEYGCHARDVLLVQRERVLLALRVEEPSLAPMGRDERVESDGYRDQRASDVARQLADAALMFSGVLGRLDDRAWQRTLLYNHPHPLPRTLAWVAVHTLHEMVHHLADIERQIDQSNDSAKS